MSGIVVSDDSTLDSVVSDDSSLDSDEATVLDVVDEVDSALGTCIVTRFDQSEYKRSESLSERIENVTVAPALNQL